MTLLRKLAVGGAVAIMAARAVCPAVAETIEKPGSLHVQCDGKPNNMTTAESAARLVGIVALVGLLAPPPESADASKRKQGTEGVAICSLLIEGEQKEGNPQRRVQLILARALHHIEANSFEAALADAKLARSEAQAAGLMADPYYARSAGRAFDLVEGAALFRMGQAPRAVEATVRGTSPAKHSVIAVFTAPTYGFALGGTSAADLPILEWRARNFPLTAGGYADRLEELGRFEEAAGAREALASFDAAVEDDGRDSALIARAALSHALAGNWESAAARAGEARANFEKRKAGGKPDKNASDYVEVMDLYGIAEAMRAGDLKGARRLFGARSQWVAASFGAVVEMNRRLRLGASPDELIGGLAPDPDALWTDYLKAKTAAVRSGDGDNKSLYGMLPDAVPASSYESLARAAWRTDKSSMIVKRKPKDAAKSKLELMFNQFASPAAVYEAYRLHAALTARARGHQGFVMIPIPVQDYLAAGFLTGNRGDPGLDPPLFNDAEQVIAELSEIIPSPEMIRARRAGH